MARTDPYDPSGDHDGLVIRPGLVVPEASLDERFSTSGGPGGQHANRARTRVVLRLDLRSCPAFSDHQRALLIERFGDEIVVTVDEERSQLRNRSIARERMAARLRTALVPQRTRNATRATRGSQRRRLESKRQRSETKQQRRRPGKDD
ncbi:MAG TPA: alternative ribosome rescue aminoacyl-tRNA hydrolase ArfB [Microthrixaceae bacterium]|nr:alternative ribosome rescue aminoacyl-tRNA hydrolase ArfB [Microthrixaceae bacterium]